MYTVEIKVMPLDGLLDPQGNAVLGGLGNLGLDGITDVRIGKIILLQLEADNATEANEMATRAAKELLANQVMEKFEIEVLQPAK